MSLLLPNTADSLSQRIGQAAFAFRGYNVTNMGRTGELWQIHAYQPILRKWLLKGSRVCSESLGRSADLVRRVEHGLEPGLSEYAEAVALVMAIEMAQLEMMEKVHDIQFSDSKLAFGYSLGELTAIAAGQFVDPMDAMRIPISLASDCATLATDVQMGILFSRTEAISEELVQRLCEQITAEAEGVIGISAMLSPNTYLLLGQRGTLTRFKQRMHDRLPKTVHLKRDANLWPPMHTPIVRQLHIPDRASVMMESMSLYEGDEAPQLLSLVTGSKSYQDTPTREILRRWVDHPQRLWDVVMGTLREDVNLIVHVGPEPNVVPATFSRLSDNVSGQLARLAIGKTGVQAVTNLVHRRWLASLLPDRATLLRAPGIEHLMLEDWLIENAPS